MRGAVCGFFHPAGLHNATRTIALQLTLVANYNEALQQTSLAAINTARDPRVSWLAVETRLALSSRRFVASAGDRDDGSTRHSYLPTASVDARGARPAARPALPDPCVSQSKQQSRAEAGHNNICSAPPGNATRCRPAQMLSRLGKPGSVGFSYIAGLRGSEVIDSLGWHALCAPSRSAQIREMPPCPRTVSENALYPVGEVQRIRKQAIHLSPPLAV